MSPSHRLFIDVSAFWSSSKQGKYNKRMSGLYHDTTRQTGRNTAAISLRRLAHNVGRATVDATVCLQTLHKYASLCIVILFGQSATVAEVIRVRTRDLLQTGEVMKGVRHQRPINLGLPLRTATFPLTFPSCGGGGGGGLC
jgi:hypothetical protein